MRETLEMRAQRRWLTRVILFALAVAAIGLALAGAITRCYAAEGKPVMFDCAELAVNIAAIADFRDTGARLEPVVRLARERYGHLAAPELAALEREIRRLWRERLPADEAAAALYRRCRAQLGDMGRDA